MKRIAFVVSAISCLAAEPAADEVKLLLGLASAAPAEIAADAKLRIAEEGAGISASDRLNLIEEAFALAAGAQLPYRRVAVDAVRADTAASFQASASGLGLDRLALEARAVQLMLRLSPGKAQELAARIQRPSPATPSCSETLIPDPSAYWETFALLASRSGSDAQARIETLLASIESVPDLAPAARILNSTRFGRDSFDALLGAYAAKLESATPSYRALTHTDAALRAELAQLIVKAKRAEVPVTRLAHAYRAFLTANLKADRCTDKPQVPAVAAAWFNSTLRGELPEFDLASAAPSTKGGTIANDEVWSGEQNERVRQLVHQLRVSDRGVVLSSADRAGSEWRARLADVVNELNSWRPTGTAAFHQKATVLQALVELAPSGDDRALLIKECVGFLSKSAEERQSPAGWYSQVDQMHQRLRLAGDSAAAARLLDAYRGSGNASLALYAMLNRGRYRRAGLF